MDPRLSAGSGVGPGTLLDVHSFGGAGNTWTYDQIQDLETKLAAAGYQTNVTIAPGIAPLIGTLFHDVLKGAKYGKSAHKLVYERDEMIRRMELEIADLRQGNNENKQPKIPAAATTAAQDSDRIFRLVRLAGSAIFIAQNVMLAKSPGAAVDDGSVWGAASTDLLSALLSYEKELDNQSGVPSEEDEPKRVFLSEFHELWRAYEERDLLKQEAEEKEQEISRLLRGGEGYSAKPHAQTAAILKTEGLLCRAVEELKCRLGQSSSPGGDEMGEASSKPLLTAFHETRRQLAQAKSSHKKLESEHRKLEKKFAGHLKVCTTTTADSEPEDGPVIGPPPADVPAPKVPHIHLRSTALWLDEKKNLIDRLDQRANEITSLQGRIADLEAELHEKSKFVTQLEIESNRKSEEIRVVEGRCDLFESEFRDLDELRIKNEGQIRMLKSDLADAEKVKRECDDLKNTLEALQLSFAAVDRDLLESRDQCANLTVEVNRLNTVKNRTDNEIRESRDEIQNLNKTLDTLNESLRTARDMNRALQVKIGKLEDELQSSQNETVSLQEKCDTLLNEVQRAHEETTEFLSNGEATLQREEELRQAYDECLKQIEYLTTTIENLKERNMFLVNQVTERQSGKSTPTIQRPNLKRHKHHDATPTVDSLEDEIQNLLAENEGLLVENHLLREKLNSEKEMLKKAIDARRAAQNQVNQQIVTSAKVAAALDQAKNELDMKNSLIRRLEVAGSVTSHASVPWSVTQIHNEEKSSMESLSSQTQMQKITATSSASMRIRDDCSGEDLYKISDTDPPSPRSFSKEQWGAPRQSPAPMTLGPTPIPRHQEQSVQPASHLSALDTYSRHATSSTSLSSGPAPRSDGRTASRCLQGFKQRALAQMSRVLEQEEEEEAEVALSSRHYHQTELEATPRREETYGEDVSDHKRKESQVIGYFWSPRKPLTNDPGLDSLCLSRSAAIRTDDGWGSRGAGASLLGASRRSNYSSKRHDDAELTEGWITERDPNTNS